MTEERKSDRSLQIKYFSVKALKDKIFMNSSLDSIGTTVKIVKIFVFELSDFSEFQLKKIAQKFLMKTMPLASKSLINMFSDSH